MRNKFLVAFYMACMSLVCAQDFPIPHIPTAAELAGPGLGVTNGQLVVTNASAGGGGDVYAASNNILTGANSIVNTNASAPLLSVYGKDSAALMVLSNSFTAGSSIGLFITVDGANGPALEIRRGGAVQYQLLTGVGGLQMYSNVIASVGNITPATSNGQSIGTAALPFSNGVFATSLTLGGSNVMTLASSGGGGILTNFFYYRITSEVSTISFSPLPQTRSVLKIVCAVVGNRQNANGDNLGFRFNGDSGTNYPYWYFYLTGDGSFNSDESLSSDFAFMGAIRGAIGHTGLVSVCYAEIPEYTNSTIWKSWMTFSHAPLTNAASKAYMYNTGGSWQNANAITSLTAVLSFSNLVNGYIGIWGY